MKALMSVYLNALDVLWDAEHIQLLLNMGVHALLERCAAQQVKACASQQHIDGGLHWHAGQVGSCAGTLLAPAPFLADPPACWLCQTPQVLPQILKPKDEVKEEQSAVAHILDVCCFPLDLLACSPAARLCQAGAKPSTSNDSYVTQQKIEGSTLCRQKWGLQHTCLQHGDNNGF